MTPPYTDNGNVVSLVRANAKNIQTIKFTPEMVKALVEEALEGKTDLIDYYLKLV